MEGEGLGSGGAVGMGRDGDAQQAQDLAASGDEDFHAAQENGDRQGEEEASVTLDGDAESDEVGSDGADHEPRCDHGAKHGGALANEEENGDEFDEADGDSSPRFRAERREDEPRLGSATEFEPQGLGKNSRGEPAAKGGSGR